MPARADFRDRRNPLQAEVLARIAAGGTLTAVCAEADMPHKASVCRWAAKDQWFADALADAQRRGTWRRWQAFDEAKARAFLARLAAGEPLYALHRDPAMPRPSTLRYWRASQGEFAGEVFRLIGVRRAEHRRAIRKAPQAWDEALADRVLLQVGRGHSYRRLRRLDPSLPGQWVIQRWRRERPDFDSDMRVNIAAGRRSALPVRMAAVTDTLCAKIVEGGSLNSLGGRHGLPSRETLYRWVGRDPAFARDIAQACDDREDWYGGQLLDILDEADRLGMAETRRRTAPLSRQLARLKNRPGKRWTRSG